MPSISNSTRLTRSSDGKPEEVSTVGTAVAPATAALAQKGDGRRAIDESSQPRLYASALRHRSIPWLGLSFISFVVLPAILSIAYYAFVASPQFAAEARLVVRASEVLLADTSTSVVSQLGSAASSTTSVVSASTSRSDGYPLPLQNAYIVAQYIRSPAIVADLSKTLNLREIFRRPEADFLARLANNASAEVLVEYWQRMVRSYVDGPSAIVTFQVRAFRPDDALRLAEAINLLSERLVNEISWRSRQDIMRASEEEVRQADAQLRLAFQELQVARDAEGMLDPSKSADDTGKLLLQLMVEKTRLEGEYLAASRSLAQNAPSVRHLRSRVEIIEGQIANLRATLAGKGGPAQNIAASLRKFEELERNRFVADKLLTVAEEGLNRARKRAERQNLYFMVFVPPAMSTDAEYPERLAYSVLLPVAFLVLWGIGALLFAAIEDHRV